MTFDFSTDVIPKIIEEIKTAKVYVRIAIFQLHDENVLNALEKRLKEGLRVEVITLPYDSINKDIRPLIEPKIRELERVGANVYFNRWNIGDPSRTTTAVGRWYSFHGKFMVTDKSAIALSANLTQEQELDALIILHDARSIKEFNLKFEQILDLFIIRHDSADGSIHNKIIDVTGAASQDVFELPENIGPEHAGHWIRHYPLEMCPSPSIVEERLYITPFDCRGRDLFIGLIEDATQYAYISTESFTDLDFSDFLVRTAANKGIDIRILTGGTSMDFTDRIESMFRDLLAQEIDVRTTAEDLHAKLLITDKILMVSSINLNKINLGFCPSRKYWRENTESVFVCRSPEILSVAKEKYLAVFDHSHNVRARLTEKLENTVKNTLSKAFGLESSTDARRLFASFILKKQIDVRKLMMKIGKITRKLMLHYHRNRVEKQDFISAIVLYYLSERKQDITDLKKNIDEVDQNINLASVTSALEFAGFVEREGEYFKINVEALFS